MSSPNPLTLVSYVCICVVWMWVCLYICVYHEVKSPQTQPNSKYVVCTHYSTDSEWLNAKKKKFPPKILVSMSVVNGLGGCGG